MAEQPDKLIGINEIVVHTGDLSEVGEVYITREGFPTRIFKLLLSIFFWVLVTIVNALTPLVHLVAVPLSIAAGVYFSYKILKGSTEVASGKATCPTCKEEFDVITGKYSFPVRDTCTACGREVILSLSESVQ